MGFVSEPSGQGAGRSVDDGVGRALGGVWMERVHYSVPLCVCLSFQIQSSTLSY